MSQSLVRATILAAAVAASLAAARTAIAQSAVVAPGMSRDEVVRALGKPTGERSSRGYTYLFFANSCERTCGTSDVVTLEDGQVSDAVFRKPGRVYSGHSSSPSATAPSGPRLGQPASLRVAPRAAVRRPAARPATGTARRTRGAAGAAMVGSGAGSQGAQGASNAASPAGQTRALIVPPRRATPVLDGIAGTDSGVTPRGLADTTTSTGTRFGNPLSVAPGPRTPQTPGLGAPPSRDSTVRNGVQLPPGSVPVPFQGARPSPVDSARLVNERARTPAAPAQPQRTPR